MSTTSASAGSRRTRGREVSGQEGVVLLQTDAKNNAFARVERPPTVGASLELTLDSYLQFVAERELEAGVAEYGAAGGTAVIMEPHSGDVLALANWPTFNPNAFQGVEDEQRRNRAVEDVYEPGSTFKIVTASAALEEKAAKRSDRFDVSSGSITFGSRTIRDVHTYNQLSFDEVIVKSSNVGAIKIGLRLGPAASGATTCGVRLRRIRPRSSASRARRRNRVEGRSRSPTARWRRCRWAIRLA